MSLKAAILSIGSELLRGDIVDTNSVFLAHELVGLGAEAQIVQAVPDDLPLLEGAIRRSLDLADLVVCSGGLGPTQDDLTRDGIARVLGEERYVDERLVADITERFQGLRRRMPESNRRQAEMIAPATSLPNANGTAPGWYVEKDGKIIVTLPGPPREMEPMWRSEVLPRVEKLFAPAAAAAALMTFGLGESTVEEKIADIIGTHREVVIATYAKSNGVQVHVTARSEKQEDAEGLLVSALTELRTRLGDSVFGEGDVSLSERVGSIVKTAGLRMAAMESATGGELANLITNVDGSSEYFAGGIVAYTREVKAAHGVELAVMEQYGLISSETAASMARAVRRGLGADVGIATTGIAGREPVEGKVPGTCFLAVDLQGEVVVREIHRPGERSTIKHFFAQCALDLLRRQLERKGFAQT